jgi:3-dehydroquinate synthetase
LGLLSHANLERIGTNITKLYAIPSDLWAHLEQLYALMLNDKKNSAGKVKMVLLEAIGKAVYDQIVDRGAFENAALIISKKYA